jgi:hypothetical protein
VTYAASWISSIRSLGFRAGLYCDVTPGGVADAIAKKAGWDAFRLWAVPVGPEIWIRVDPRLGADGYRSYPTHHPARYHAEAFGVQYAQAVAGADDPPEVFGVQVDLNSFPVKDPSAPEKKPEGRTPEAPRSAPPGGSSLLA